ncbi:MAG: cyclic nucleotide-binding domain-containing protein [Ghiorsea sp.]|nr:cyclic nucleotide-binding domain-containing protein [Ghiorsea sp.]
MVNTITKKELDKALDTYANLVEMYPNNESYLHRYAKMLQTLGREATATITLQHLHHLIAKRSASEAKDFAKQHPQIGRILLDDTAFEDHDKHAIVGQIIHELTSKIWLKIYQRKLKEGQAICRAEDLSDTLTLMLEGNADIFTINSEGMRVLVEHVSELDILGEHTFLKPNTMDIDVFVSSESAKVVQIPRKKVLSMIAGNPHLEKTLTQRASFRRHVHTLARNDVFQSLPLKLTQYLARKLTIRHYAANTLIYDLKTPVHGIDIVIKGKVCYLAHNRLKAKVMLSPLPPLSIAGDTSLRGGKTTSMAELAAKTDVSLAHIAFDDLLNVSVAYPPLKEKLMQHADMQKVKMMQQVTKL